MINSFAVPALGEAAIRTIVAAMAPEPKRRFGHYPARILADKIYRNKNNRDFCKNNDIHLSGPRLGRPGKDHAEEVRAELKEVGERNAVEGKFGNGKRKLVLSLVMAK